MGLVGEVNVAVSPEPVRVTSPPLRRPVTRLAELALEPEKVSKRFSIFVPEVCACAVNENPIANTSKAFLMASPLSGSGQAFLGLQDDFSRSGAVEEDRAVARDHAHARGRLADRLEGDLDVALVAGGFQDLRAVLALLGADHAQAHAVERADRRGAHLLLGRSEGA